MIYQIFKIWAQLAFTLYFRRIYISGSENIPKKEAVLLLVNHPNSFLEPCVIAAFQHRNLHFLVRGDMFEKKWLLPILKSTNQIPIYRLKDGFGKLRNNKSTFDQAFKVLEDKHTLLMFPEASSELVKYLRPLQKGAARLALGAIEETQLDELYVIPTGIHYYDPTKSRNDVILKFGKIISVRKWLNEQTGLEDKIQALTQYFQEKMDEVVISIQHQEKESIYNEGYILAENDQLPFTRPGVLRTEKAYTFLKNLVQRLNLLSESSLTALGEQIKTYQNKYTPLKSFDIAVCRSFFSKLKIIIATIFFFVLGLPGFLLYAPSLFISKYFAKSKIKHITFYPPVRVAVNMGLHILNSIPILWIFSNYCNSLFTLLIFIFLQISLYCFAYFLDYSQYTKYLFHVNILKNIESLRNSRREIIDTLSK